MSEAQHELSITRFIDAPPEAVYRAWTERPEQWFAPRPWTTPKAEWELRPGGRMLTVMRSPEGEDMPGEGVFLKVAPNEKIVFTNIFTAGWQPRALSGDGCDFGMVAIITFEPEGKGTRYTARVGHWDEATLKRHEEIGFHEGWSQCTDQLAELAEAKKVAA